MSAIKIRVFDADRKPIEGRVDVRVSDARGEPVAEVRDARGGTAIPIEGLESGLRHHVRVFPSRYRPVSQLVVPTEGPAANVHVFCPVDPEHVTPSFPTFDTLPGPLQAVLDRSTIEAALTESAAAVPLQVSAGALLYDRLTALQKAGLLNLFCKMSATPVGPGMAWDFVDQLHRTRADRIFAHVRVDFRDHVKSAASAGLFDEVSGALHDPGVGFTQAGSFKTDDRFGNLQLTFFASSDLPLRFRIDADIDDANGLGHVFQVLRNAIKDRTTHPYDIHQLLTFHQRLRPVYDLSA